MMKTICSLISLHFSISVRSCGHISSVTLCLIYDSNRQGNQLGGMSKIALLLNLTGLTLRDVVTFLFIISQCYIFAQILYAPILGSNTCSLKNTVYFNAEQLI